MNTPRPLVFALLTLLLAVTPWASLADEGPAMDSHYAASAQSLIDIRKEMQGTRKVLTPEGLAKSLFKDNIDVAKQLEVVTRARDNVSLARSALLPSINLGLSMTLTNPPMFLVNSVSCLVPFLFPSNWYGLKESKANYSAEIYALHATRLNTFAAAYSLLAHIYGDLKIYQLVVEREQLLHDYVDSLKVRKDIGSVSQLDVDRAVAEHGVLKTELSKLRELITTERASLREMAALGLDVDLVVRMDHTVGASRLEDLPLTDGLEEIYLHSPERVQVYHLIRAAEANVSQSRWAFLGGCSGSQGSLGSSGTSGGFTTGVGVNFGFGYFPSVRIAKSDVRTLKIRDRALRLEFGRILESTFYAANESQFRMDETVKTEAAAQAMLERALAQQDLGVTGVRDTLDAFNSVMAAKTERISAESALAGHRITLQRLMLEGLFKGIWNDSKKAYEQ